MSEKTENRREKAFISMLNIVEILARNYKKHIDDDDDYISICGYLSNIQSYLDEVDQLPAETFDEDERSDSDKLILPGARCHLKFDLSKVPEMYKDKAEAKTIEIIKKARILFPENTVSYEILIRDGKIY